MALAAIPANLHLWGAKNQGGRGKEASLHGQDAFEFEKSGVEGFVFAAGGALLAHEGRSFRW